MWTVILSALAWLRSRPAQLARGLPGQSISIGLVAVALVMGLAWLRRDAVSDYAAASRAATAEAQVEAERAAEDAATPERARLIAEADQAKRRAVDLERRLQSLGGDDPVVIPQDLARSLNQ